jgi:MoxR-like ATPase
MGLHTVFAALESEISAMYLERDEQVKGLLRAILAGEHVLLLGPPGTAKSATICELIARINGADMFETLLTPFSSPEEVFGPVSIQGLQADKYERILSGYLPEAHVGFVDEVFKANSAILNSLLTIMAERKYKNGRTSLRVPLISLVGASNETPQEDNLGAMYDRFMLRYVSSYVSASNVVNLLRPFPQGAKRTTITLAELKQAQAEVETVAVSDAILEEVAHLKHTCENAPTPFKASDRRWRASVRLLKACAYLDGRDSVASDDLMVYANVLWDNMADANVCASVVGKVINPAYTQVVEHADAIDKLLRELVSAVGGEQAGIEALVKIKTHKEAMSKIHAGEKGAKLVATVGEKVNAAIKKSMRF